MLFRSIRLAQGDTAYAERTLARVAASRDPRRAEAELVLGQIATARRNRPVAERLIAQALAGGADTAQASAARALLAAHERRWDAAITEARRAMFGGRRHTFSHQFPHGTLGDALAALGTDGPPAVADSLVTEALAARPGWSRMYAVRAAIALRVHDCDRAFEAFLELLEFGVDRPDWPAMVQKCREERG